MWWRQRRLPWAAPIFAVGLLLFWLRAAQPLSAVLPFIRNSASMMRGYGAAMSLNLPNGAESIAKFAAVALILSCAVGNALWRRMGVRSIPPLLAQLVDLTIFKAGFMPHDRHEVIALSAILLQCVLWFGPLWIATSRPWLRVVCVVPAAAGALLVSHAWPLRTGEGFGACLVRALPFEPIRHAARLFWACQI